MSGKGHLVVSALTAGTMIDTYFLLSCSEQTSFPYKLSHDIKDFMLDSGDMNFVLFILISGFLYMIGSLLPDIDLKDSMIGRFMHLPFKHRTWTHAIWWPAALIIVGIFYSRLFLYLGSGIFLHDLCDSFSSAGLDWFYPVRRRIGHLSLYDSGSLSEFILVAIIFLFVAIYTFIVYQITHGSFRVVF